MMLGRTLLVFVIAGLWCISNAATENVTTLGLSAYQLSEKTRAEYEDYVSSLLISVRRAHFTDRRANPRTSSRGRRAVRRPKQVYDDRGVFRLTLVEPLFPVCSYNRHVSWTRWNEDIYAVCTSNQGSVTLGRLTVSGWSPVGQWDTPDGRQSVVFHHNNILYAVVAQPSEADGVHLLRYDSQKARINVDHTIHSRYATAITLWTMNHDNDNFHLAIANSHGPSTDNFHDFTYIYDWQDTYFDHYDSVPSNDVCDLESFHIYGHAYLAVANRRTANDIYDVDSEVFRFDINTRRWRSFQKIPTQAVSDVHFFEMGPQNTKEYFFVVANQFQLKDGHRDYAIDSVIYKMVEDRFVPFQCIKTHGASGVSGFSDPHTGAFILAFSNLYAPVQLYQYDGWSFVPASVQFGGESMSPGATHLTFLPWKGFLAEKDQLALVVSHPRKEMEVGVFALTFRQEKVLSLWYSQGMDWCQQAQQRLNDTGASDMLEIIKKSKITDGEPLVLQGPVVFQNGLSVQESLQTPKVLDLRKGTALDYSLVFQLDSLHKRLLSIKERIRKLKSTLSMALRTSGTQIVTGQLEFESISASCGSVHRGCDITSVETVLLNERNVQNLKSTVVFLDQPNKVIGSLKFAELHVQGDVQVLGSVDGINVSDVVMRDTNRKIVAEKTFAHTVVASNINIQGTLGDFEIGSKTILLTEGDQELHAEMTFTELEMQDLEVTGLTSGVDLQEFYEDVVIVGGGVQRVTGTKMLKGPVTLRDLNLEDGTINGVDLVDLWNHAVWLDREQTIHALLNTSQLHLVNPSVSTVNGVQVPGPRVTIQGPDGLLVTARQKFLGEVIIDTLEVEESINDLKIITSGENECPNQLDIMLKSCQQTVIGTKTFVTLGLGGRTVVTGRVNNFDLNDLAQRLLHTKHNLTGHWVLNQVEILAPVVVKEDLIGWEVEQLYHRALKLTEPLPDGARVIFKSDVETGKLWCPDINGVDVGKDLFLRRANTIVASIKHWENLVLQSDAKAIGGINGINIDFLRDVLVDGPLQQVLHQHRIIEGDLIVNSMQLDGMLAGVDLTKAVHLNADLEFRLPVRLENATVHGDLMAASLTVASGTVNGRNFVQTLNDTMIYSLPQKVLGKKTLTGDLIIPEGSDLNARIVGGLDLKDLHRNTVFQHISQNITGKKTFSNHVRFENLVINGSINGVSVWEIFNNWLLHDETQTISADVLFKGGLKVDGEVKTSGLVNGVDIPSLERDLVRSRQPFEARGMRMKTAKSQGDIALTGKVNGVDLSEEAVRTSAENVIRGRKEFKNMLIHGDLLVDSSIDGVDIGHLCQFTARRSGQLVLDEVVVRGDVTVSGDVLTTGPVNDIVLQEFKENVVMLNQSQVFDNVEFEEIIFQQPVVLRGLLNGVDLSHLEKHYMSLTRDQDVTSKVVFHGPVIIEGLVQVQNFHTSSGMIGSVNVRHVALNILTTHNHQTVSEKYVIQGNLHFMNDVTVSSSVNGLHFPKDVAVKSRPNVVSGPVVFSRDLIVTSDLDLSVGCTIQGVDVSVWASETVMTTGSFTLTGLKSFEDLRLRDVRAFGLFGGTNISESTILLKKGTQVVRGKVSFGGSVQVKGGLSTSSKINGVDVRKLLEESVVRNRPCVISGRKVFLRPLVIRSLSAGGFVAGVNLTELALLINRPQELDTLHFHLAQSDHSLAAFHNFLTGAPRKLSYYSKWFQWEDDRQEVLAWVYLRVDHTQELLILSRRSPDNPTCSRLVAYQFSQNGLVKTKTLPSSFAVKLETLLVGSSPYLIVANVHSHCDPETGGVQVFSGDQSDETWQRTSVLVTASTSDVGTLLPTSDKPCLASALLDQILIHCFDPSTKDFPLKQIIPLPGVLKVSFASCKSGVYLSASAYREGAWFIHVFTWDGQEFVPLQKLPAYYPVAGPVLIASEEKTGGALCLLVVSENSQDKKYSPPTNIYRFDTEANRFREESILPVKDVISVKWDHLPSDDLSLTFLTRDGVSIYIWKGAAGFVLYNDFSFQGGRNLLSFVRGNFHYLALSGLACDLAWWQTMPPNNVVYRARIKG